LIKNISVQYPNIVFSIVSTEEARLFACYEIIHNGEVVAEESINPQNYPPEMDELYKKAETSESDEIWEEWYEADSEWNNDIEDRLDTEARLVTLEYLKHVAKKKRRTKEGKETESFIPLT
jgi:hypothetical protein